MKEIFDNLWSEYLAERCAVIDTDYERALAKQTVKLHEVANELLSTEQIAAVEKYIDSLCDIQGAFVKKAFVKGCEFALALLFEFRALP